MAEDLSLETFKYQLLDVARPNKFFVNIFPSEVVRSKTKSTKFGKEFPSKFMVQSASIPDRSFNEIEMKYYGMSYKIPAGEMIQDLTITFLNDIDWETRTFFEIWANRINSRYTNLKGTMTELSDSKIIISQLNSKNQEVVKYTFHNVFPKILDQIELSMESNDSIETFQVTFSYSYYTAGLVNN